MGLSLNTLSLVKFLNFERDEKKKSLPHITSEMFFLESRSQNLGILVEMVFGEGSLLC